MSDGWMGKKVRKMTGRNAVNQQVSFTLVAFFLFVRLKRTDAIFLGGFPVDVGSRLHSIHRLVFFLNPI
jgi:hypothetical protein